LHEYVEDNDVLIYRSPEVVSDAVDLEEDFIQMPFGCQLERAKGASP
jgi:hypothetical protein